MWNLVEISRDESSDFSLELYRNGEHFMIRTNGYELMTTMNYRTEVRMAEISLQDSSPMNTTRVLVGGLGLGYTTRRILQLLSPTSNVVVCEISKSLLRWSNTHLKNVMEDILEDSRLRIVCDDVQTLIAQANSAFDMIILDVDNGPQGLTTMSNDAIYSRNGLKALRLALAQGGRLAIWSGFESTSFENIFREAGFEVIVYKEFVDQNSNHAHYIYIGTPTTSAVG